MENTVENCVNCGGQEFYLQDGYYFCQECQTQQEGKREEVVEFDTQGDQVRLRKTRIRKRKTTANTEISGWTTWEKYNFILIGLTNQLIELGASPDIKITILQLWSAYLRNLEVAFKSTKDKTLPRLAKRYDKRDALIIYGSDGKQKQQKARRKSAGSAASSVASSSTVSRVSAARALQRQKKQLMQAEYDKYMQSQDDSEADRLSGSSISQSSAHTNNSSKTKNLVRKSRWWLNKHAREEDRQVKVLAKKVPRPQRRKFQENYVSQSYLKGPQIMTAKKLWAILFLALRINDEQIHMSDMLRYSREGHLSYYRLEHLLPAEVTVTLTEINKLNPSGELSFKGLRFAANSMAKFIQVWQLPHPNLVTLLRKFCTELQLPEGICLYAERIMASSPPVMTFAKKCVNFPNYEGRIMAIIIVVMKILFGLDGITEYRISDVIARINTVGKKKDVLESRLFNFREWQRYIECRRCILVNEHLPTKLKRDPSSSANSHLYSKFFQSIPIKQEIEVEKKKGYIPPQLASTLKQEMENFVTNEIPSKEMTFFSPSLTPQYSYLRQLLQDPNKDLPNILHQDFCNTKVGYITVPESLQELAAQCDIDLNYIDTSPHFAEKIVQTFEPSFLQNIQAQRAENLINEPVRVISPVNTGESSTSTKKSDDPAEYLHRKNPGKIHIDTKKQRLYKKMIKLKETWRQFEETDVDDFGFDQVHPNGKLMIPEDDDFIRDNDDDINDNEENNIESLLKNGLILSNFEKQTVLGDVSNPWAVEKKFKYIYGSKRKSVGNQNNDNIDNTDVNTASGESKNGVDEITIEDDDITDNGCDSDSIIVEEVASGHDPAANDFDEISILSENIELKRNNVNDVMSNWEQMTFFRPFKEYWMHRCQHFSHITSQYFRLLERNLPVNFRWLLHECAHIVEMNPEELYEEVCIVENYFGCVYADDNDPNKLKKYNSTFYRGKAYQTVVTKQYNS